MTDVDDTDNVVFRDIAGLCRFLGISERRLRVYKRTKRLNYSTGAVIVDRIELAKVKKSIMRWWHGPYIPHRFRHRVGKKTS